ncbi:MAG TPA: hypothetical protein EYH01_04750 [Campylobacterales bacterium]|nr:hypothetical protein [Campylobacterales bacterium]HIP59723.1 hypothetical protein [Campylobacterales bacterium]
MQGEFKKKIISGLLILGCVLGASEAKISKERIEAMRAMENAMATIQKGFLYNDARIVEKGVKMLKDRSIHLEPPLTGDEKYLKKEETYKYKFTKKQAYRMNIYADDIQRDFYNDEKKQAMYAYTKILKQCMSCHSRIRKW